MAVEMIPDVAKIHFDAFAGYMNTRIGSTYIRAFLKWFLHADRAIALAAIDGDGKVVGYVVGAPLGYERAMSRDLLGVVIRGMIARPWLFLEGQFRGTIVERLKLILGRQVFRQADDNLPERTMSLVGIGVSSSVRGKRVGLHLLDAFEAISRGMQMRALHLSVRSDNTVARRLYEKCGWRPLPEYEVKTPTMCYVRILDEIPDNNRC
jgi:ribosomal protein S18 acetylase RimI-like enzyme